MYLIGGLKLGITKYRTQPLEEALKECFRDEMLFGGVHETSVNPYSRKVAVTAATETGEQAVIFTNYNRADDEQGKYNINILIQPN